MLTRRKNTAGDQTGVCLTFERLNQCSEEKVDAADETQGRLTAYSGHGRRAVRREGARACTSPGDLRRSNPVRQRREVTGSAERSSVGAGPSDGYVAQPGYGGVAMPSRRGQEP